MSWTSLLLLATGCGSGAAALLSGGGGSDGNAPPSLSGLAVVAPGGGPPKTSPARVRFVLADREADPARVTLSFRIGSEPERLLQAISGDVSANPTTLATASGGREYALDWDFTAEGDPQLDGSYVSNVVVRASVDGGTQQAVLGANGELGLGNDAPVVHSVVATPTDPQHPEESAGNVELRLRISDSSADPVDVRVEWRRAGDAPDAWSPATAAGVFPDGIETLPEPGVQLSFFWNTNVDLADAEDEVLFRVTADDRTAAGALETQATFRIDNNEEPRVDIDGKAVLFNTDERRTIPIPFRLFDDEGDEVEVVFQWRRQGETFPDLPDDPATLLEALADPAEREALRICAETPRTFEGRAVPVDERTVRLPEVGSSAISLLAYGLEGRRIELLRASNVPESSARDWKENPLRRPVAALPEGDGLGALVLDEPATGTWRLREIELATGAVLRELATGTGRPTALAREVGSDALLLATAGAAWSVLRVERTGDVQVLATASGAVDQGRARALLSIGSHACLLTAGDSLVRVGYDDPVAPRITTLASGLEAPWGLARDPLEPRRIYLALSGRADVGLVTFRLDTLELLPVGAARVEGSPTWQFEHPRGIALDRRGNRLLALSEREDGRVDLRALVLGTGTPVYTLAEGLTPDADALAAGAEGMTLVTLSRADDLLVGDGVQQVRIVEGYDTRTREARVDRPFDPPLRPYQRWRVPASLGRPAGAAAGRNLLFLWDTAAVGAGDYLLRASVYDAERGERDQTPLPMRVRDPFDGPEAALPDDLTGAAHAVDIDNDGDLDLVGAHYGSDAAVRIWKRDVSFPGSYWLPALDLALPLGFVRGYQVADIDRDGLLDVAVLHYTPSPELLPSLFVLFQEPSGEFTQMAVTLGSGLPQAGPFLGDVGGSPLPDIGFLRGAIFEVVEQATARTFLAPRVLVPGVEAATIRLDDIDADGDRDLLVWTGIDQRLELYLRDGAGFPSEPSSTVSGLWQPIALGDMDLDGDLDLVARGYQQRLFVIPFQAGGYVAPREIEPSTSSAIALHDLDGDGDLDIFDAAESAIWRKGVDDRFVESDVSTASVSLLVGDFDGDGNQDLLNRLQSAPGALSPKFVLGDAGLGSSAVVGSGDLDLDGRMDVVTSDGLVRYQDAPGWFGERSTPLPGAPGPVSQWFDADGDGDLDSAWILPHPSLGIQLIVQSRPNVFEASVVLPSTARTAALAFGDLDRDGDIDLVSLHYPQDGSGFLTLWLQGDPLQYEPIRLDGAARTGVAYGVSVADLDADGDEDILTGSDCGRIAAFEQVAPGVFKQVEASFGFACGPSYLASDFDLDGDVDVSIVNGSSNAGTAGMREADWSFSIVDLFGFPWQECHRSAAGDLDSDGDLDLVGYDFHEHVSPGVFRYSGLVGSLSSQLLDVDADGEIDLVASDGIRWNGH